MKPAARAPRTIAVFCPNLIGDAVMATPAIRALRGRFPDARIIGVIKPKVAPTLAGAPWFDEWVYFDSRDRSLEHDVGFWSARRALRAARPDVAVLLPNSHRSAVLALFAAIPRRVGFTRPGRGLLLTDRLEPPRDARGKRLPTPITTSYVDLVAVLGCRADSLRPELFTTPDDEADADRAWSNLGLDRDEKVVCLNTGGAFGPSKNWPVEHFAKLARRLVDERGRAVLVVCGPGEAESARRIASLANDRRIVSLADERMSIGLTKACIKRAELLVTTDSGPRHFAAAFRVPVVTLFGPTFVAWTRTQHPHAIHVMHPVPCGPCQKPVCPLGHQRCMTDLRPDDVFAAASRLLG